MRGEIIKEIRALTIAQPWVECIIAKGKNIENRSWNTKFRGFFAIHASKSKSPDRFNYCHEDYGIRLNPDDLSFGAIVGFAEIVDVISKKEVSRNTAKWFSGEFGFVLKKRYSVKKAHTRKGGRCPSGNCPDER